MTGTVGRGHGELHKGGEQSVGDAELNRKPGEMRCQGLSVSSLAAKLQSGQGFVGEPE